MGDATSRTPEQERIYRRNRQKLVDLFESGAKPARTLGVELEHVLVRESTGFPVGYSESEGVRELLCALAPAYDDVQREGGDVMGLARPGAAVTIEPAGQLELSAGPFSSVEEFERAYLAFRTELDPLLERLDIAVPLVGYHPSARARDLPVIPKFRYESMTRFLGEQAYEALCMMRCTASLQVSIDYRDEADACRKLRLAQKLAPILALLTDNSPMFEGKPAPFHLVRTHVWSSMKQDRVGTVPGSLDPAFGFADYADYILTREAILVPDGPDGWRYVGAQTFAQVYADREMTDREVEHALSMVWPDARLKTFVEIRPADALPFDFALSYVALVKGLFYREENLRVLDALLADVREGDVAAAKAQLVERGFGAQVYGRDAGFWADALVRLAASVADERESAYFEPLSRMVENRFTLAEVRRERREGPCALCRVASCSQKLELPEGGAGERAPRIGILPRCDFAHTNLSIPQHYTASVFAAGGLPVVLPLTCDPQALRALVEGLDGFIVTGGGDVDPRQYGQRRDVRQQRAFGWRDEMDFAMVPLILESGKPLLGVCRGMQVMNVSRGGTLHQDVASDYPDSRIRHRQKEPYTAPAHEVEVVPESMLAGVFGQQRFEVNTIHHQSVDALGSGVRAAAFAPDGVVEAIELTDVPFAVGVQWHPEYLWREHGHAANLFRAFVQAAAAARAARA